MIVNGWTKFILETQCIDKRNHSIEQIALLQNIVTKILGFNEAY